MSTPRTKRQFAGASADPAQRQITSFFNKSSGSAHPADAAPARQPELPSSVQANLLSVGMRVRKSVPEGYKTAGPSAFKLWTDAAPVSTTPTVVRNTSKASSRELLPFCGINSVGGLAPQPEFEHDSDNVPGLDTVPELTMSQESTDSADSSFADPSIESSRKRIYDEDEDELDDRTIVPGSSGNSRVMAVPRSRVKKMPARSIGQDNKSGSDFEDAEFLVFDDEEEMEIGN